MPEIFTLQNRLEDPFSRSQMSQFPTSQMAFGGGMTLSSNSTSPVNESVDGVGVLIWVNQLTGLINCQSCGLVSFEIKDFCDQNVVDLSSVLRNGFILKFQAALNRLSPAQSKIRWCATFVSPLLSADIKVASPGVLEVMIGHLKSSLDAGDDVSSIEDPTRKAENYSVDLEGRAIKFILSIFTRMCLTRLPMSSLHCYICNCGEKDLYTYIGSNGIKRRQFLEKRSHVFRFHADENVHLLPPPIHATILKLASQLLLRGGAMPLQELFDNYMSCPEIPLEARDIIGEGKNRFLQLLEMHPWVFAVFPSRVFVALRRKLVDIDYGDIWEEGGLYDLIDPDGYNYTLESAAPVVPVVSSRGASPIMNGPSSISSSQSSVAGYNNNPSGNSFMFGPNGVNPSMMNPMMPTGQSSFVVPPPFPPFGQPMRPPGGVPPPPFGYFRPPGPMIPTNTGMQFNGTKENSWSDGSYKPQPSDFPPLTSGNGKPNGRSESPTFPGGDKMNGMAKTNGTGGRGMSPPRYPSMPFAPPFYGPTFNVPPPGFAAGMAPPSVAPGRVAPKMENRDVQTDMELISTKISPIIIVRTVTEAGDILSEKSIATTGTQTEDQPVPTGPTVIQPQKIQPAVTAVEKCAEPQAEWKLPDVSRDFTGMVSVVNPGDLECEEQESKYLYENFGLIG